jgi:ferrochelatase
MDGRVAVLLGGYGEVEHEHEHEEYNERSLRLLVSKSIKFPEPVVPLMARLLGRRTRREWRREDHYHSPHNDIFERQRAGIELHLRRRFDDDVSVYTALNFCDGDLPEQVLPRIREAGFDRLVVYPLEVLDSVFTSSLIVQQVNEALGDDHRWIREMRYLPTFVDRSDFADRVAEHVMAGVEPLLERHAASQVGVMLLLHGCPLESKGHDVGIRESEQLFHAVRSRIVARFPLVHVGWMNHPTPGKWTQPDMSQSAENLIELGARAIAFAPIGFVTDNHETMLDVGYVVKELGDRVETLTLPSLNDDDAFLELAADWVAPLVAELRGSD